MRSLRLCSDSSATPSFPSQPEGKIGLPRANPRGCSNYRTIALISHASRVMLKILQARDQTHVSCITGGFWFFSSCGGILELRRGSQPSPWVGPGKPNLPLELQGKSGGCARVTAEPKRPHLGVCPGPNVPCLTLRPHESQHARPPCPSPTPGVHSNSCPSSQ